MIREMFVEIRALSRRVSILLICVITPAFAQPSITPQSVMDKVSEVDTGDNASSRVTMSVLNPKGDERTHELISFRKKFEQGSETRGIMFYVYPMTMKNVGYFSIDFKDDAKTDQHWMYTPTIQKMRRIGSKRLAIMNSDFSYADMSLRHSGDYTYNTMKEDVLDGNAVWVIEGVPNSKDEDDEEGYAKSIFYVRQDNFIVVRVFHYLKKGNKVKQMDVSNLAKIDGIWIPGEVTMVTRKDGVELSRTIMKSSDVKFNQNFNDNYFSQRQLTRGPDDN